MIYALIYLSAGILLLIFKTPIRKLVDDEISKIRIQYAVRGEEPPSLKLILFRITVSVVLTIIYPIMLFVIVKEKLVNKSKKEAVRAEKKFVSKTSFLKKRSRLKRLKKQTWLRSMAKGLPLGIHITNGWIFVGR